MINSALGFDSFVVMRHGQKQDEALVDEVKDGQVSGSKYSEDPFGGPVHGSKLGCYFCNDVSAPGNVKELLP